MMAMSELLFIKGMLRNERQYDQVVVSSLGVTDHRTRSCRLGSDT